MNEFRNKLNRDTKVARPLLEACASVHCGRGRGVVRSADARAGGQLTMAPLVKGGQGRSPQDNWDAAQIITLLMILAVLAQVAARVFSP